MTEKTQKAEQLMLSMAVMFALRTVPPENLAMWLACLREVLPKVGETSEDIIVIRSYLEAYMNAQDGRERSLALDSLALRLRSYFERSSAARLEKFRDELSGTKV
ncbi:hypothetical protein [Falsihalocynthiibacter sp. CO-5D18]|uniref:hypothetical protein n=1 Tax=Falsihalocynthiibacter sp. CO-5D18 TaxID=3240872 RepID=UPI00350EAA08